MGWPGEQREVWAGPAWPRLAGTLPGVEAEILYALRRAGVSGRVVRVAADTNGFLTVAALTVTHPVHSSVDELQTSVGRLLRALFEEVPALDEVDVTAVARHRPDPAGLPDVTFTAAASRPEVLRAPGNLPPAQLVRGLPRVWVHPLFDRPAERLQEILRTPPLFRTLPRTLSAPSWTTSRRCRTASAATCWVSGWEASCTGAARADAPWPSPLTTAPHPSTPPCSWTP